MFPTEELSEAVAATWADDPIRSPAEDRLDRTRFARMVAQRIDAVELSSPSMVFGLVGAWGSGKSSAVELVVDALPDNWNHVSFTPWAVNSADGLVREFFRTIQMVLAESGAEAKEAKEAIRRYAAWATPLLKVVPVAGGGLAESAEAILDDLLSESWHVRFSRVSEQLQSLHKRVLIVCDDIDRLDDAELLELLKVIRLLGRFPNVHYLLAYDQSTVEDLLTSRGIAGRRSSFMEKIVQHPFELPPMAEVTKLDLAVESLNQTLRIGNARLDDDGTSRASDLISIMAAVLSTPRAQYRFRHQLNSFASMHDFEEVDFVDFAAFALIRLHFHELYEELPQLAPALRPGLNRADRSGKPTGMQVEQLRKRLVKLLGPERDGHALRLLRLLFPQSEPYGSKPRHPKALADEDYFDRYYFLGVPPNDVSDLAVRLGVAEVVNGQGGSSVQELADAIDASHASKARLAIAKAEAERQGATAGSIELIGFLDDRVAARSSEPESAFESPQAGIFRWLAREVLLAHRDGLLTAEQILERYGEQTTVRLLFAARSAQTRNSPIYTEVAAEFRRRLEGTDADALLPLETLRLRLTLLTSQFPTDQLEGLLDARVLADERQFAAITQSLVEIQRWHGSDGVRPELEFDARMWRLVISAHIRARLTGELPISPPLEDLDAELIEPQNISAFAFAAARRAQAEDEGLEN